MRHTQYLQVEQNTLDSFSLPGFSKPTYLGVQVQAAGTMRKLLFGLMRLMFSGRGSHTAATWASSQCVVRILAGTRATGSK